jgi:hypothetical protein
LSKVEAETLAKATAEVAKYYPTAIDPKTIAWVNLATCMGLTYGPRVYMVRSRLDKEAKAKRGPAPAAPTATAEAAHAASFIPPGMPGAIEPVSEAGTM